MESSIKLSHVISGTLPIGSLITQEIKQFICFSVSYLCYVIEMSSSNTSMEALERTARNLQLKDLLGSAFGWEVFLTAS